MIKEFWKKLTSKKQNNKALTRKEQVLAELDRGAGTARPAGAGRARKGPTARPMGYLTGSQVPPWGLSGTKDP